MTGASATRRPNRFETAAMAAAVACVALAAGLDLGSAPNTAVFLASGLALLTLATTYSGRWLGLDALVSRLFARRRRPAVPDLPVRPASPIYKKEPIHGT